MKVKQGLLIGELSQQVNLPLKQFVIGERLGFQPTLSETPQSQYRIYSEEATASVSSKSQAFRAFLDEIKQLIEIRAGGIPPRASPAKDNGVHSVS